MTAMLAKTLGKAYGIEIVREAVDCADGLKSLNKLQDKMSNRCGKVEDIQIPSVFFLFSINFIISSAPCK